MEETHSPSPFLILLQAPTHPVYNICPEKVAQALQHFLRLPATDTRSAEGPAQPAAGRAGPPDPPEAGRPV